MSERLLKRRVTDEGTTYMQLLNETRHDWSDNTSAMRRSKSPKRRFSSVKRIRVRSTACSVRGRANNATNREILFHQLLSWKL
jgi:CheY-like chemotaxis protein